MFLRLSLLALLPFLLFSAQVLPGVDLFFLEKREEELIGKNIGILTNQTGRDKNLQLTSKRFLKEKNKWKVVALFSPEHGIDGSGYAAELIGSEKKRIPIYSLHGKYRRPTKEMLKKIDVIIFDIQEIGIRPYTYLSTLCYLMEEAAKYKIKVIVLDRPNPIGGNLIDGPMLEEKWRSFIGYLNVPYCHGMTIGELAQFFNAEYSVGCDLEVVPMRGWKRSMTYQETGLKWIPTSPFIPNSDTPLYCASTGALGELSVVSIGIGYTLPFKVVGAPWMNANSFADHLNNQKLPGVHFTPFHFKPFWGAYKMEKCHGVYIEITDQKSYRPLLTQYAIMGILKSLYPIEVKKRVALSSQARRLFCQANGTESVLTILEKERFPSWKLREQSHPSKEFLEKRKKYLIPAYSD